ncbi:MAG: hypothetical protein MMC33_001911 [Icmadophila ericetorum]|nr:hypothetical protein [Icmadophila ericetorum]
MAELPPLDPFPAGSYSLYRLSPLHFSDATNPFLEAGLRYHAHRLGNGLKGDFIHGEVELSKAGPYKSCKWTPLTSTKSPPEPEGQEATLENGTTNQLAGIRIDIEFEKATFSAFLLNTKGSFYIRKDGETYLPILAVSMPATLRPILTGYLAKAFDTNIESLRLSNWFINAALEDLLQSLCCGNEAAAAHTQTNLRLTIGFLKPTAPSLKKMDITIRSEDIFGFLNYGRKAWNDETPFKHPLFRTALRAYLETKIGLKLNLSVVSIEKFDCAGFRVIEDGKVTIPALPDGIDSAEEEGEAQARIQQARAKLVERLIDVATIKSDPPKGNGP